MAEVTINPCPLDPPGPQSLQSVHIDEGIRFVLDDNQQLALEVAFQGQACVAGFLVHELPESPAPIRAVWLGTGQFSPNPVTYTLAPIRSRGFVISAWEYGDPHGIGNIAPIGWSQIPLPKPANDVPNFGGDATALTVGNAQGVPGTTITVKYRYQRAVQISAA